MILIGRSQQLFDVTYIFGKQSKNKYINLPKDCSEGEEFIAVLECIKTYPGEVLVLTQSQERFERLLHEHHLLLDVHYFFFDSLKLPYFELLSKELVDPSFHETLWNYYRKIYYTPHSQFVPCHHPMYEAEITCSGKVFTCCSAVIQYDIGTLDTSSFKKIWHSPKAKLLRLSVLNGTAIFCSSEKCQNLISCKQKYIPKSEQVSDYPLVLNFAMDSTCNLSCPSCRNDIQVADQQTVLKTLHTIDELDKDLYKYTRDLYVAGNGECMVSHIYQSFLENDVVNYFNGNLHLLTNGLIINDHIIKAITAKFRPVVLVSIDAGCKRTYEAIRCGGRYERVYANIRKYVEYKRKGLIASVIARFVIQVLNYSEIPLFIENMRNLGVDRIEFTRLVNGGTFSDRAFESASLLDNQGKLKEKYLPFFRERVWPYIAEDISIDRAYIEEQKNER